MTQQLELQQFEANSFMGISSDSPVIIDFTARRKGNVLELSGNQGVCKTSTLCGIMYAMGATFDLDKKKLLNSTDNTLDINLKFKYNGEQYHVIGKPTRLELKKQVAENKWVAESTPVAMLRKIFGAVGLSPFNVKTLKGKDQIKYFQDMFGSGEDASKKMAKLEADIEALFQTRREVNREAKALSSSLELEPLYQNYELSQNRFKTAPNATAEKKKMDELAAAKLAYDKHRMLLHQIELQQKESDEKLKALAEQLKREEAHNKELADRIAAGKKHIKDNAAIEEQYEAAQKKWINISKELSDYDKWKQILSKEKQLLETQDAAITATSQLDALREKLLKLTKECLPKVEGLDIRVAAGLDKTDKPEGVFYHEQPIHELSESEYTALWCQIWEAAGVNHVFIENISSLGTDAVSVLNEIANNGGMVFATKMDRKHDEIIVTFKSKI